MLFVDCMIYIISIFTIVLFFYIHNIYNIFRRNSCFISYVSTYLVYLLKLKTMHITAYILLSVSFCYTYYILFSTKYIYQILKENESPTLYIYRLYVIESIKPMWKYILYKEKTKRECFHFRLLHKMVNITESSNTTTTQFHMMVYYVPTVLQREKLKKKENRNQFYIIYIICWHVCEFVKHTWQIYIEKKIFNYLQLLN